MTLSLTLLTIGILAYGVSGSQLTIGSRHESGALRSIAWWVGTALQGGGFLATFLARHELSLLVVQAGMVAALGVTALIQQVMGIVRFGLGGAASVLGVMIGLVMLTAASDPGPVPVGSWAHFLILLLCVLPPALAMIQRPAPLVSGLYAGVGFAVGAIAARLLAAAPGRGVFDFGSWGWVDSAFAMLIIVGLGVGQYNLTVGLAHGHPLAVLGSMYATGTVLPAVTGWLLLGEHLRHGFIGILVLGIICTSVAAIGLVRLEAAQRRRGTDSDRGWLDEKPIAGTGHRGWPTTSGGDT